MKIQDFIENILPSEVESGTALSMFVDNQVTPESSEQISNERPPEQRQIKSDDEK